jgi:hypothetical protein
MFLSNQAQAPSLRLFPFKQTMRYAKPIGGLLFLAGLMASGPKALAQG